MSINTGTDISGLSANTQYTFSLYPINANGQQSTTVTQVQFTTLPKITSATVATATSYNSLALSIAGAYSTVSVEYSTDGSSYNTSGTTSTSPYTVSSLSANQRYYFKLTPYNSNSAAGTTAYISDTNVVTLGYINTFTASNVDSSSVILNWTGVYSNASIYYGNISLGYSFNTTISSSSTDIGTTNTKQIFDLSAGRQYYFTIYPYNSNSLLGSTATIYKTPSINYTYTRTTSELNIIAWYNPANATFVSNNLTTWQNECSTSYTLTKGGDSTTSPVTITPVTSDYLPYVSVNSTLPVYMISDSATRIGGFCAAFKGNLISQNENFAYVFTPSQNNSSALTNDFSSRRVMYYDGNYSTINQNDIETGDGGKIAVNGNIIYDYANNKAVSYTATNNKNVIYYSKMKTSTNTVNYYIKLGSGYGRNFYGYYGDFFVFNTSHTTDNQQYVEAFLSYKYGVTLPNTHPYYNTKCNITF